MKQLRKKIIITISLILLIITTYMSINYYRSKDILLSEDNKEDFSEYIVSDNLKLKDNKALYPEEEEVTKIYVTVYKGTNDNGTKQYTFEDLNNTKEYNLGINEPVVYANVKVGSKDGVENQVGYNSDDINATMKLRGHSTRNFSQKSYKLKLYDGVGEINNSTVINLNKHPFDYSLYLNKLSFDLMKDIPNIVSFRTNFVHLYIKDLSSDEKSTDFVDYGLFTQIENPDKEYLKEHGLDEEGNFYKAESFEYALYPDNIKSQFDDDYNEDKFREKLDIINAKDHTKLINTLKDINNYNKDINEILDYYFDKDNYYTWLAINILLGNLDTTSQNFLIYSPRNSIKWYILPLDYDGTLRNTTLFNTSYNGIPSSMSGIHRYMSVILHKRVMSNPENRELLKEKVEEIYRNYINKNTISKLINKYLMLTQDIIFSEPDLTNILDNKKGVFLKYLNSLGDLVEDNYINFLEHLNIPTPFYIHEVVSEDSKLKIKWDPSKDFGNTKVTYELKIATDLDITDIVYEKSNIIGTEHIINLDENNLNGDYYITIFAYNELGKKQYAFNNIRENLRYYYGIKKISIK